jgi:DNA polymerase
MGCAALKLHLDYETRSEADLKKVGAYAYAEHPSTDVLCAAYALDDGPVKLWFKGENTGNLQRAIEAAATITAHNAQFERIITGFVMRRRYGFKPIPIRKMRCTMVMAYALGLPGSLANAGAAVGLPVAKDDLGRRLMLAMCKPRRPKKGESGPGPFWRESPEDLARLGAYCATDVEVERLLEKRLLPLSSAELELWFLDQKINDRGVFIDLPLAEAATKIVATIARRLDAAMFKASDSEVRGITDLSGLIAFCKARGLADIDSLAKDKLAELLIRDDLVPRVRRCLEIRQEGAKASVAKINALTAGRNADGRARGFLQFHAANTGRWAGRRFQPQNLKRPENKKAVASVIDLILAGDPDILELVHGPALSAVGDTIRGMVRAAPGAIITAADYSNIEGRVLAWLAGETWKIKAFAEFDAGRGADLYKLAYARAFGIPIEQVEDDMRQVGKVMELSLGYQGGPGAFAVMAKNYGVKIGESYALMHKLAPAVAADCEGQYRKRGRASGMDRETWVAAETLKTLWRNAHPAIVQLWADLEAAAILAVEKPGMVVTCGNLRFRKSGSFLFMRLPSGRAMAYPYPLVMDVPYFGKTKKALTYKTVPDPLKPGKIIPETDGSINMQWARISTYGGMMVENAVQAAARDILGVGMTALDARGYRLILHVHDEPISEDPAAFGSEVEFRRLMTTLPRAYAGLPVTAGSFRAERYRK